jgi:hypothetical protein
MQVSVENALLKGRHLGQAFFECLVICCKRVDLRLEQFVLLGKLLLLRFHEGVLVFKGLDFFVLNLDLIRLF